MPKIVLYNLRHKACRLSMRNWMVMRWLLACMLVACVAAANAGAGAEDRVTSLPGRQPLFATYL